MTDAFKFTEGPQRRHTTAVPHVLLGQVLLLVAVAIGFAAVGAFLGQGLSAGAGVLLSLLAIGMVLVQAFAGDRFRVGSVAVLWLFGIGLSLGLGTGPVLAHYASVQPNAISDAAVTTTLVVAAMGVGGFALNKDLSGWLRPLTFIVFGLFALSVVLFLLGNGGSPIISLAVASVSAVLILVDVNYLRHHGTEDDAVVLATGIFVSVVNIFLSLLNITSNNE